MLEPAATDSHADCIRRAAEPVPRLSEGEPLLAFAETLIDELVELERVREIVVRTTGDKVLPASRPSNVEGRHRPPLH
jgi:hypothetical protein